FEGKIQSVIKESQIQTDVCHCGRLPLEFGVGQAGDGAGTLEASVKVVEEIAVDSSLESVIANPVIPRLPIASPDFEIADGSQTLHKGLFTDPPASRESGEIA